MAASSRRHRACRQSQTMRSWQGGEAYGGAKPGLEPTTPNNAFEHPAVKAWRALQPQRVDPCSIHNLKEKARSAFYRPDGVGARGSAVIAKVYSKGGLLVERT